MIEKQGNIFNEDCDVMCITTNGFVKSNGECVMGRGCAQQAKLLDSSIPKKLGDMIRQRGNVVNPISKRNGTLMISFPVKRDIDPYLTDINSVVSHMRSKFSIGDQVPGWACVADIGIIEQSAVELVRLTNKHKWTKVVLPRPGCGAGELSWATVKKVLDKYLDDRFICMTY